MQPYREEAGQVKSRNFSLTPFLSDGISPNFTITGSVTRSPNILSISYILTGNLSELVIPKSADSPERKDNLWEETCFELFIGSKDSNHYWEFNLSPSGDWNVYRFKAYREERTEEPSFTSLPFVVQQQMDALMLSLEFDLDKLIAPNRALNIGISAVIKHREGMITRWALKHPCNKADFHNRESFIIEL
jgi:hypothetical protein